jgi:preprotein translocase subunit Sec63
MCCNVVSLRSLLSAITVLAICMSVIVSAVRDMKFYKVLGVDPKASDKEIKKAYKKAALCVLPSSLTENSVATC